MNKVGSRYVLTRRELYRLAIRREGEDLVCALCGCEVYVGHDETGFNPDKRRPRHYKGCILAPKRRSRA